MYSIVLATMLTTGAAAPDFGRGCHGCCGGCYGCCGGCYGCWGGCYGCCGGCYGCCGGCWGGCYGCCGGCYGCYGGYSYGGWGMACYGCYGGWGGCYGCYGGVAVAPVAVAPGTTVAPAQTLPAPQNKDEKKSYLGNAAEVVVKAPVDVQLSVDERVLPRTANQETFRTPELEAGYSYTYTFKARVVRDGKTVSYAKQVKVRAGQTSVADFTKLTSEGKDTAQVTVKLPAEARLYIDDVPCPLTSASRTFTTPDLNAGQSYYYTLKAEVVRGGGKPQTASQRVLVEAGKQVTVEFKDLMVKTASR
jgi:uncharacterized protein (TIGR03000 family)